MPIIHLHIPGEPPLAYTLECATYTIGRGADCSIVVDRAGIGERHCVVTVAGPGDAVVRDGGAETGTWVDGRRVNVGTWVAGQELVLGDVRITWELESGGKRRELPGAGWLGPETAERETPAAALSGEAPAAFWREVPGAMAWALGGDRWIPILFLAVLTHAPRLLPGPLPYVGIVIGGIVGLYALEWGRQIILEAANGDDGPDSAPDILLGMAEIKERAILFIALGILAFTPGMLLSHIPWVPPPLGIVASGLGWLYFPMALLGVALLDTPGALSPVFVFRSIARVWGGYVVILALFLASAGMEFAFDGVLLLLPDKAWLRVVVGVGMSAVLTYGLLVTLRLLGLLYWRHRDRLAWSY